MSIQSQLREIIDVIGLRKVARDLGIDHASLYRSLTSDPRLSTIQGIATFLGYDLTLIKRKDLKARRFKVSLSGRRKG